MASRRGRNKKRQHTYRGAKSRPGIKFTGSHRCPQCGKWCYPTRDDAEAAVGQIHPGSTVHYYKCLLSESQWWHFTSMSADQVRDIRVLQAFDEGPEETAV
jgi:hypothetical protein